MKQRSKSSDEAECFFEDEAEAVGDIGKVNKWVNLLVKPVIISMAIYCLWTGTGGKLC